MSKRTKNLSFWLLCIAAICILSCRKDYKGLFTNNEDTAIAWARDYYDNVLLRNGGNLVKYKSLNISLQQEIPAPNIKRPMWFRAKASKTHLYTFVEVPLMYTKKLSRSVAANKSQATDLEVLKAGFDRLIIYKDKNGNINQCIISYIPNKNYLTKHKGDISHNRINKLDKDFSGYLRYSNWDGKPLLYVKTCQWASNKN